VSGFGLSGFCWTCATRTATTRWALLRPSMSDDPLFLPRAAVHAVDVGAVGAVGRAGTCVGGGVGGSERDASGVRCGNGGGSTYGGLFWGSWAAFPPPPPAAARDFLAARGIFNALRAL
jgi:hypothetical protein